MECVVLRALKPPESCRGKLCQGIDCETRRCEVERSYILPEGRGMRLEEAVLGWKRGPGEWNWVRGRHGGAMGVV